MNSGERLRPPERPAAAGDTYIDYGPPIPDRYGILTIGALVRDPRSVFIYWEWPNPEEGRRWAVRLRETTTGGSMTILLDRSGAGLGSTHIEASPDCSYEAELGWVDGADFKKVKTSNRVRTPRDGPSTEVDREWAPNPEEAEMLGGLAGLVFVPGSLHIGIRAGPSHA